MLRVKQIFVMLMLLAGVQGCTTGIILGTSAAVGGGATAVFNDRRHPDVQRMDGEVCGKIVESLKSDPALDKQSARIRVGCFNKVVLLAGETVSDSLRRRIIDYARLTNVRKIHNEITLSRPIGDLARENDTVLATNVRTALIRDKFFDASLVETTTSNGVVYLMGLLTRAEAGQVENSVSRVPGVRQVVSLFEYVNLVPAN